MLHFIVGIIFKNTQNWHVLHIASCNLNMIFFVYQSFWLCWHLISIEFIEGTLTSLFIINNSCILLTAFDVLSKFWKFPTWFLLDSYLISYLQVNLLFVSILLVLPTICILWMTVEKALNKTTAFTFLPLNFAIFFFKSDSILTTNLWMLEVLVLFFYTVL